MTAKYTFPAFAIATCILMPSISNAESESPSEASINSALKNGDVTLSLRMRYEEVNRENSDKADLTSLKTRLSYTSKKFQGFGIGIEVDDVTHLEGEDIGILDPEGTEVNQAYIAYSLGDTTVKYGRQRILLDNQRFVGGVGFRQNEQTYDALSITNTSLPDTKIHLSNINNVNRIFGEDSPAGDHRNDSYLLNAKYSGLSLGSITGYAYLIDNEDNASFSTDTYGVRFSGKSELFSYTLEYATQSDAANNTASYDADYLLLEGSFKIKPVKLTAGYELLGADGSNGQFITPLATLHKFQGWNDNFLGGGSGNITGGIEDIYFTAGGKFAGVKLLATYHQYSSDDSGASGMDDLGSEFGLLVAKKFGPVALSAKYSDYSADDFGTDNDKLWLTAAASF